MNRRTLDKLARSKFELSSTHETFGVSIGPNRTPVVKNVSLSSETDSKKAGGKTSFIVNTLAKSFLLKSNIKFSVSVLI